MSDQAAPQPADSKEQARGALNKMLGRRPSAADLERIGVLKSGGMHAAARAELERNRTKDFIGEAMHARPDIDELIARNVVESTRVAPPLAAAAKALERRMISDKLNRELEQREALQGAQFEQIFPAHEVAPRLRQKKIELEHALTRDQLTHLLEGRPDPEELLHQNILQTAPTQASRIAGVRRTLEHHMTQDRVAQLLEKRQDIESLQQRQIIGDVHVAPALQPNQRKLQMNLARSNLYHALKNRPSIGDFTHSKFYNPVDVDGEDYSQSNAPSAAPSSGHRGQQQQQAYYGQGQGSSVESGVSDDNHARRSQPQTVPTYQRRSKNFHLTRILLKSVASMAEAGEISLQQKGVLKDLIVDQDSSVLAIAEEFDSGNDLHLFKESLVQLASRQG